MKYGFLGRSGLEISRIALGCMGLGSPKWQPWVRDERTSAKILRRALDLGVTFFEMSDIYSDGLTEEIVGRVVLKAVPRDKVVLATITHNHAGRWPNYVGVGRKQIMDAIDASLRRLGTDYVDLYQVPRYDWLTPDSETMEALNDAVKAGKARYIGASAMMSHQFAGLNHLAALRDWTPFVSMSNHYNLMHRDDERDLIPYCRDAGVGLIPFSPLARGMLARGGASTRRGKDEGALDVLYQRPGDREILKRLAGLAKRRGVRPAQIALAWLLSKPTLAAPVVGVTRMRHLEDAVAAVDVRLEASEIDHLEAPYQPRWVPPFDIRETRRAWSDATPGDPAMRLEAALAQWRVGMLPTAFADLKAVEARAPEGPIRQRAIDLLKRLTTT